MSFAVGSLVVARHREWVVLPGSDDEMLLLRPLAGVEEEKTGVLPALEGVKEARFDLPDPASPGDHRSAGLLRDALRLGFRSSAGPFRSLGHLAVEPRPYQFVPLLMALRQDPVRILIADDVGIGKTIEAGLIARELLDQGDAQRLAVLCPPHLAEQWQRELREKFHLDAVPVLASTAPRLERDLPSGGSIFEEHPYVIVSTDFIKADRRRADFIRACPELVIVDEAHTCAVDDSRSGPARHQRHELVRQLADDPDRHLVLVTATPHSGKEGAFRSLLSLLNTDFAELPDDLSGDHNRRHREELAKYLVQRRRQDVRALVDDTPFPERKEAEQTYRLTPEYRQLFGQVLSYAQEIVRDPVGGKHRQRVRWWSALALLRALASSPAAAVATLQTRAAGAGTATVAEADEVGRQTVLDLDAEDVEPTDVVAGAVTGDEGGEGDEGDDRATQGGRARLQRLAAEAEALRGDGDAKLVHAAKLVKKLDTDGFRPIVFCRYIATANYVAAELRQRLPTKVEVEAVTGELPPAEREVRVKRLAEADRRVLVATDCLSEGINLQDSFDAVFHYDLPWNPTRLEQREGRVDRFGQARPEVRVVTYYGEDTGIDRIVLDVLLRKHRAIRNSLGISIPVPGSTDDVIEAVAEGLLTRDVELGAPMLPGMEEYLAPRTEQLMLSWDQAADQEKRSRSIFAQHTVDADEVIREVEAVREAIGSPADTAAFVTSAVPLLGGWVRANRSTTVDVSEAAPAVRDALGGVEQVTGRFKLPVAEGEQHLARTHPLVAGLASYLLNGALDQFEDSPARRSGVVRTDAVTTRTTLLLVRYRFHLTLGRRGRERHTVAEDCGLLAFTGAPTHPAWLDQPAVALLMSARPTANVMAGQATQFLNEAVEHIDHWQPRVEEEAHRRADALREAHMRVRTATRSRGGGVGVTAQLPADILGLYIYLPGPQAPA